MEEAIQSLTELNNPNHDEGTSTTTKRKIEHNDILSEYLKEEKCLRNFFL